MAYQRKCQRNSGVSAYRRIGGSINIINGVMAAFGIGIWRISVVAAIISISALK